MNPVPQRLYRVVKATSCPTTFAIWQLKPLGQVPTPKWAFLKEGLTWQATYEKLVWAGTRYHLFRKNTEGVDLTEQGPSLIFSGVFLTEEEAKEEVLRQRNAYLPHLKGKVEAQKEHLMEILQDIQVMEDIISWAESPDFLG